MPGSTNLSLTVNFASKEKKQKIMRLGKKKEKDKDNEAKNQTVEGISRLICSAKTSHNAPFKGKSNPSLINPSFYYALFLQFLLMVLNGVV